MLRQSLSLPRFATHLLARHAGQCLGRYRAGNCAISATHLVECGPGKVLAGLTKRIEPRLESFAVTDAASLARAIVAVRTA